MGFDRAHDFDWATASIAEDVRHAYPERRFVAVGYLDDRLHVLCFTPITDGIRVISFRKANKERQKNMVNPLPLTDEKGEVRELTSEDFKYFRPAVEVLPELFSTELVAEMLSPKKAGRPRIESPKVFTGIRLDAEVIAAFRATGRGWQTRMNDALKEWLKEHAVG